ncbi:MAG: DUF4388 domain-containing protein [Myxococcota bacterium]|nr:DUF4388 domain-containing protein [Myxococcota bacterium]
MGVALHGNLRDFGIAEVFQLIGQQRKTGALEIGHEHGTFCLKFDAGCVAQGSWVGTNEFDALADMLVRCGLLTRECAAQLGRESLASARAFHVVAVDTGDVPAAEMERIIDLLTQDVVFEVLRLEAGSFHFSARPLEHDRLPGKRLAAEQILMEGLRMVDEWATFAVHIPREDAVLRRAGSFADYSRRAGNSPETLLRAERLVELVDGRLSVRRIIDLSRLGTFDGTRILAGLKEAGTIEVVESARAVPKASKATVTAAILRGLKTTLLAVLPMALLGGTLAATEADWFAPPQIPGVEISARTFERGAAEFERLRLLNALEAHRYLWASWPVSLERVDRTGWSSSGSMAAPDADSYYYSARGDEVVLLSPAQGSGH